IRLGLIFFKANVKETLTYRASFIAGFVSVVFCLTLSLISISILTYQSMSVGGWTKYELFLAQGIYSIILGIMYFVFRANFKEMSRLISRGDLDLILLKPYDSQYLVSVGKFIMHQLSRIVIGMFLVVFSLHVLDVTPTLTELLMFVPLLVSSLLIIYSLWFFITTLSIWLVDLFNLDELFIQVTGVTRYPLEIFKFISNILLYITMPLVVITTVPSQILLGKLSPTLAFWSLLISISLFIFTRKFWQFALKHYTSASS
ncbi:MAG: ABC-2 family transporter protein, partial [Patescibacteria group bacterium]